MKDQENRFTLRCPALLVEALDKERASRVGNISRNTLILEMISEALEHEKD